MTQHSPHHKSRWWILAVLCVAQAMIVLDATVGLLLGGALTQWIDWRAVMYVNDVIAVFALSGVLTLLVNERPAEQPRLDLLGAVVVTAGLSAIVFGFSRAETTSWSNSVTI